MFTWSLLFFYSKISDTYLRFNNRVIDCVLLSRQNKAWEELCMYVFLSVCVYTCICTCVWRPEVNVGCLSPCSLPCFWRYGLSLNLELPHWLCWLADKLHKSAHHCPSGACVTDPHYCLDFYKGSGDLNSESNACTIRIFPSEPSLLPQDLFLYQVCKAPASLI